VEERDYRMMTQTIITETSSSSPYGNRGRGEGRRRCAPNVMVVLLPRRAGRDYRDDARLAIGILPSASSLS
jgi:hypothetical protein